MPAVKQLDTGSQQPTLKSGILSEYSAQPKIPLGEQNKLSSWPISGDRGESLAALLCDSPRFMVFITSAQYCDLGLSQDSGRRYLCILRTIASVDTFNVEVATINQQRLAYSLLNAAQRPDIYYSVVLLRLSVSLGSAVAHAGPQNWLPPLFNVHVHSSHRRMEPLDASTRRHQQGQSLLESIPSLAIA